MSSCILDGALRAFETDLRRLDLLLLVFKFRSDDNRTTSVPREMEDARYPHEISSRIRLPGPRDSGKVGGLRCAWLVPAELVVRGFSRRKPQPS